ncbi:hypothetical protein QJU23_10190 [Pasteurella atlantica]|uniref:Uncharacterized protein n=2 Tax=Pasteurellaceae TaxID=712 RepID=A0ACC6HPN7_9PAST|nr:hypothetical protein [Pasteurella atlantica]MDP8052779.1 hypothetical protein [Pasteurella atlantica]MDP8102088.1 hypothetical protein [Pasteurella atlantica]MDP8106076.1 hypothetical protein [Pasteurella atlantica]MDP8149476.1 hypothetical protein [Pasteurella atlantica]
MAKKAGRIGILIKAKNKHIANWYHQFGTKSLPAEPLSFILPFSIIENQ